MQLHKFFERLGFTKKETEIFLAVYKLGTKPASTIAKHVNLERTYVYKTLRVLTKKGVLSETKKGSVTHFFVPDISILKKYITNKMEKLQKLEDNFSIIETELAQYHEQKHTYIPKISIFDGLEGIGNIYNDMYQNIIENKYLVIKFFASNTFETQIAVNTTLKDYSQNLFQKLKDHKVTIDGYLGNGILIMEQITKTTNIQNLDQLPAGNSAINMFIVGKSVYLIIFKDIPFGLKIDSEDLSNAMHFIFEKLKTE